MLNSGSRAIVPCHSPMLMHTQNFQIFGIYFIIILPFHTKIKCNCQAMQISFAVALDLSISALYSSCTECQDVYVISLLAYPHCSVCLFNSLSLSLRHLLWTGLDTFHSLHVLYTLMLASTIQRIPKMFHIHAYEEKHSCTPFVFIINFIRLAT